MENLIRYLSAIAYGHVIACGYTDMRKQIDGLVAMVELQFGQKLDETSIFLFCGRRADRIKAVYWDGTGYVLFQISAMTVAPRTTVHYAVYKDIEEGNLKEPTVSGFEDKKVTILPEVSREDCYVA